MRSAASFVVVVLLLVGVARAKDAAEGEWWLRKSPVTGEVCVYHTGWLGQWLVVCPKTNLVAVRLREFDGSEDPAREPGGLFGLLDALLRK